MVAYSFIGAFLHYTGITDTQCDEEDAEEDFEVTKILSKYDELIAKDVLMISKNDEVIGIFKERIVEIEKHPKIDEQLKGQFVKIMHFIINFKTE